MRILIVEDEETQRTLLAGLLRKEGYTVEEAGNGSTAMELLRAITIDLALLDFKLPDMDGLSILKGLKEINPEVEVIILSGHASMDAAMEINRLGGYDYLMKPCELEQLLAKVEGATARKRGHEQKILEARLKEITTRGRG